MKQSKAIIPVLIFFILTILVVWPLYRAGRIFLLDMSWPPVIDLADYLRNGLEPGFALTLVIKLLSFVASTALLQKIVLTLVLLFAAYCMYRLAYTVYSSLITMTASRRRPGSRSTIWPSSYATLSGLLYMINPWVYERFLAGHWLVLLGYAVFPLYILCLWRVLEYIADSCNRIQSHSAPILSQSAVWRYVLIAAIYPILSLHWAYIAALMTLVMVAVHMSHNARHSSTPIYTPNSAYRHYLVGLRRVALLTIAALVVVNSFWLIGFFGPQSAFTHITLNDFHAYQTQSDRLVGPYGNALALYGFWTTDYILPKDTLPLWWLYPVILVALTIVGGIALVRAPSHNPIAVLGWTCFIIAVFALVLGVGFADRFSRDITTLVYYWLPGFRGLRETAKLIGVVAFVYSLLAPLGMYVLAQAYTRSRKTAHKKGQRLPIAAHAIAIAAFFVLIITMTHSMFFGFQGQVRAADYPVGWYTVRDILSRAPAPESTEAPEPAPTALFLPWHGYMAFSFSNYHTIANPATAFFATPIVQSQSIDNIYISEEHNANSDELDSVLFRLVHGFGTFDEQAAAFRAHGISTLVVAKDADWERYIAPLQAATTLTLLFEDESIILYAIKP